MVNLIIKRENSIIIGILLISIGYPPRNLGISNAKDLNTEAGSKTMCVSSGV